MSYRDDLAAAHARIAALEAAIAGDHESADHERERARLVRELEAARRGITDARAELSAALEAERRTTARLRAELAQVTDERDRYVDRIRILQEHRERRLEDERAAGPSAPPILDRGARPVCPFCLPTGREVRLLRDPQLTPGVCPQCASVTLLR